MNYFCRMSYSTISRKDTKQFSDFSTAFSDQIPFSELLSTPFISLDDIEKQAEVKKNNYSLENRKTLVETLKFQLDGIASESQKSNIQLLEIENTFTLTTGHQLTLFGGPLYLIYKVLHIVRLSNMFNALNSEYKTVPVFWMASEDHDFDEVKGTQLFGKKISWNTNQKGAVGRFSQFDFDEIKTEFSVFFDGKENEIRQLLAIENQKDYATYLQYFLSKLFADFGVLVLNPDCKALKKLAVPFMQKELLQKPSLSAVQHANTIIEKMGYSPQAQARDINLFYLSEQSRKRIEYKDNCYLLNEEWVSERELLERLNQEPENFSPNVILRPVYQETILPNLAYIGGGGEMAYWTQLKGVFEAHNCNFPLIQQRVSIHLIDTGTKKRIQKLAFELKHYFQKKEVLRASYMHQNESDSFNWDKVYNDLEALRTSILLQTQAIDSSLIGYSEAELVRIRKQVESIEHKLMRQVKSRHEQALHAIDFVVDRTIPENLLQERFFHWLHFAPDGNFHTLFQRILSEINPFEPNLMVIDLTD